MQRGGLIVLLTGRGSFVRAGPVLLYVSTRRVLALLMLLVLGVTAPPALAAQYFVYVTNAGSGTVSVIDGISGSLVKTIPVGRGPAFLAVIPDGKRVYVVNHGSNTVSVIDTANNRVIRTVAVGENPGGIAISPDGGAIYVASADGMSQFSASATKASTGPFTYQPTSCNMAGAHCAGYIPVVEPAAMVAFVASAFGGYVYVAMYKANQIAVIDTVDVKETTTLASEVTNSKAKMALLALAGNANAGAQMAQIEARMRARLLLRMRKHMSRKGVSPQLQQLMLAQFPKQVQQKHFQGRGATISKYIAVGKHPFAIAMGPNDERAYITNSGSDSVTVIEAGAFARQSRVIKTIPVGPNPRGVAVSPNGRWIYVTDSGNATVSIIDAATDAIVKTIGVGSDPAGIAVSPDGSLVFVANAGSNTVSMIATGPDVVVKTIDVGKTPFDVAVSTG